MELETKESKYFSLIDSLIFKNFLNKQLFLSKIVLNTTLSLRLRTAKHK